MELLLSCLNLVEFQIFVLMPTAFLLDPSTSHDKSIYFIVGTFTALSE